MRPTVREHWISFHEDASADGLDHIRAFAMTQWLERFDGQNAERENV